MSTDFEHWLKVKDLFVSALNLQGSARSVYLDHACAEDASLRREVEGLLRVYESRGDFLEPREKADGGECG